MAAPLRAPDSPSGNERIASLLFGALVLVAGVTAATYGPDLLPAMFVGVLLAAASTGILILWRALEAREAQLLERVRAAQRNRERLHALVDAVDEGVLCVDRAGRIVFANTAAQRILEVAPAEVGTINAFGPQWALFDAEGTRLAVEDQPVRRVLRDGRPLRNQTFVLRRSDGSSTTLRVNAVQQERPAPDDPEVVVVMRDVTRDVRRMRKLQASERRHRRVVDQVDQVIFQVDARGRLVFLNPAWRDLTGHEPDASLGTELLAHMHPDDRDACRAELEAIIGGTKRHCRHEARLRRRDGATRWVEIRARRARTEDAGAAGILSDVTERRRAEERLARSRRMEAMGHLAGGVAHDFNNLLTVILGYAQLMEAEARESPALPEPIRESAREILRTSQKAASVTRQLLTFSRKQVLSRSVLNPNDVVRRYERFIARFLPASITCRVELDPALEEVEIGPAHLEQVLLNLVINARDALEADPHGTLEVRTRNVSLAGEAAATLGVEPGLYATVEVSDTGHGMDRETLARAFEPFFTTKGGERGAGMGLASVYGIVTQAGGAVDARSEPGQGSTFVVYLPTAPLDREPAESTGPV